ncbi:MAG: colanic acid biosynthesis glycosyl transferase WcaI [Dokdonia sp.]|jgi:colanic acid biosynthesis glycosyl transferase WcaI
MSKPSITIISLNYAPEDTAIGLYSKQMVDFLIDKNWEVNVITGFPYYPKWKISEDYINKPAFYEEEIDGARVLRFKQFTPSNPSFFKRALQILDFTYGSLTNLKAIHSSDIVFSIIPFTSSAWLGKRLASSLKAKHWVHIQDFEFDAAFESGLLPEKGVGSIFSTQLFKLESRILDSADCVSTISNGMIRKLQSKSSSANYLFPNWVDIDFVNPSLAKEHEFLKSSSFKVLYSGNIGSKQDWEVFQKVVKAFEYDSEIEFVIVGDGGMRAALESSLSVLENVTFHDPVPYSELNDLLCSADLHVLFQKSDVLDTVMPSKILGMMASEKPSVVTGNLKSEVAHVFKISNGGVFIDSSKVEDIILNIKKIKSNTEKSIEMGKGARKFMVEGFSRDSVLKAFLEKLIKL